MLLVTWAVGTPITCSSSSLTIRCPDRIGHQARSWHRDGRKVVTGSCRCPKHRVIHVVARRHLENVAEYELMVSDDIYRLGIKITAISSVTPFTYVCLM